MSLPPRSWQLRVNDNPRPNPNPNPNPNPKPKPKPNQAPAAARVVVALERLPALGKVLGGGAVLAVHLVEARGLLVQPP